MNLVHLYIFRIDSEYVQIAVEQGQVGRPSSGHRPRRSDSNPADCVLCLNERILTRSPTSFAGTVMTRMTKSDANCLEYGQQRRETGAETVFVSDVPHCPIIGVLSPPTLISSTRPRLLRPPSCLLDLVTACAEGLELCLVHPGLRQVPRVPHRPPPLSSRASAASRRPEDVTPQKEFLPSSNRGHCDRTW